MDWASLLIAGPFCQLTEGQNPNNLLRFLLVHNGWLPFSTWGIVSDSCLRRLVTWWMVPASITSWNSNLLLCHPRSLLWGQVSVNLVTGDQLWQFTTGTPSLSPHGGPPLLREKGSHDSAPTLPWIRSCFISMATCLLALPPPLCRWQLPPLTGHRVLIVLS